MLLQFFVVVLCLLVIVASICRIDRMRWRVSHPGWVVFYVAAAFVAGSVMMDRSVAPRDLAMVTMLGFYVLMTRRHWRCGAPPFTGLDA